MPATLYLVDGSSYIFRAFFALPLLTNSAGLPTNATYGFTQMLIKLIREEKPKHIAVVFDSGRQTFRNEIYPAYKGHRPEAPDALVPQFSCVRQVVDAFGVQQTELEGFEADDVIGTLVARLAGSDTDICIVTGDKDMMQLVSARVTILDTMNNKRIGVREVKDKLGVLPEQVVDLIALMGDPTDNIPGIKGIGKKTAVELIREFGSLDKLYDSMDQLNGMKLRGAQRLRDLLLAQRNMVTVSRELARIRCDAPVALDIEQMRLRPPSSDRLVKLFREWEFHQLVRDWAPGSSPAPGKTTLIHDQQGARILLERFRSWARVAIHPLKSKDRGENGSVLLGLGLAWDAQEAFYVQNASALSPTMKPLLENPAVEKIGYDLKDCILVLEKAGLRLRGPLFDVMVASYLINPGKANDLPAIAFEFLNHPFNAGPQHEGEHSAAERARLALRLRELLDERLESQKAHDLFTQVEMPLVRVLASMERAGVKIDVQALAEASGDWEAQMSRLMEEIHNLAGTPFNIGSPQQLRQILFERLRISTKGVRKGKTGYSTDNDVLTRLAQSHPLPRKILEYRALAKLKSTYGDALPPLVHPLTGRIHTSFNQTIAATGRLSSSNPNLQNIPIRTEEGRRIRRAFVAEEGFELLSADYSQMELRLMAHLSQDHLLVRAFLEGEDVHTRTASEVFHVRPENVDAEQRRRAKTINFGIIYGMGPQRLAQELSISREEAERLLEQYFERYRGVKAHIAESIEEARRLGYVSTLFNRRRLVPEIQSNDSGTRQAAERIAVNAPVQGSAADIIKVAMIRIQEELEEKRSGSRMILQVHDELLFEVASQERGWLPAMVKEKMEGVVELRVPLKVDLFFGRSWAEAH